MRVAIAYNEVENRDGKSDIDLSQEDVLGAVQAVEAALERRHHEVVRVALGHDVADFLRRLQASRADVIFNHCEAMFDRSDREMHAVALLELSGMPVTGCSALLIGLLLDKAMVKGLLRGAGLHTPDGVVLHGPADRKLLYDLRYPVILKPAREDASIGVGADSVVASAQEALPVLDRLAADQLWPVLVEQFIVGRELNALAIGGDEPERILYGEIDFSPLPPGHPTILTYRGKWDPTSAEYNQTPAIYPANIDRALEAKLETIVRAGWKLFGCRGFVRFDVRVDQAGQPWVLEINPNPDLTPGAGAARGLVAARISFEDFIEGVTREAIERHGRCISRRTGRAARSTVH